jgi:hypothetical protein
MAPPVAFMSTRAKVDFSTSKEYFDWIFARFAVNNTPAVAKLRSLCELAKDGKDGGFIYQVRAP